MSKFPKMNFHTHTTYCDGKDSVESMIQAAIAKDFIRLGFSGHVFNDFRPEDQDIWCMSPDRTEKYIAEVRAMAEKYKDKIELIPVQYVGQAIKALGLKNTQKEHLGARE